MGKLLNKRNVIRVVVVLLFACILGTAMSFLFTNNRRNAHAALTGSGTERDPVKIYSVADLQEFATRVNNGTDNYWDANNQIPKYVKLMSDIDLSTIANWTPIGNTNAQLKTFNGVFDGNNKTISNLKINNTAAAYSGLFGYLYGGTIKNLKLSNPDIYTTKTNSGTLAGYVWAGAGGKVNNVITNRKAVIENCHLIGGKIWSTVDTVGGLIGRIDSANNTTFDHGVVVKNCTIKGTGTNYVPTTVMGTSNVGALVGYATGVKWLSLSTGAEQCGAHIINCYSTATVTNIASGSSGGLVGRASGMLMQECYSTGAVRSIVSGSCGGLVGLLADNASKITDCFAMGDINAIGTATADSTANGWAYAGGIVGEITIATSEVLNCLYTGTVLGNSLWSYSTNYYTGTAAGIVGRISANTVYVGDCAVDSPRVSGIGQTKAAGFSSPIANGWSTNVWPAYPTHNKYDKARTWTNVYNSDMLISEQRGGRWDTCTKVSGQQVSSDAFKQQATYENILCWNIRGGSRIWGIGTSFNNGYPYLSNCPNSNQIEYPYGHRFNPIIIATPDDFQQIADNVNTNTVAAPKELYGALHLKQTADIDMTGVSVVGNINNTSSGAYRRNTFRGDYDGCMYRLQNVKIVSTFNNLGIFGATMNATFRNIVVENPMVNNETAATNHAGILVGNAWGNLYIDNCAILGGQLAVPKMARVGALVGACWHKGNYITRSFSSATVTAGTGAGGLVGVGVGLHMSQCYCSGNVDAQLATAASNTRAAGGLVGDLHMPHEGGITWNYDESLTANPAAATGQSTIDNCYAVNKVSAKVGNDLAAGGLVGRGQGDATITNSYFRGELTCGGGSSNGYTANVGGIVGISVSANVYVNNCLSVITKAKLEATGNSRVMGYYNTYRSVVPQAAMNCFYVPLPADELPAMVTTGGGRTIDGGIGTTVAEIKAAKIFGEKYSYTVTTPGENEGDPPTVTTVNADGLNWDMKNIWLQDANANDGFPMLRGLIVDTTELDAVIAEARTYSREDYSEETFSALEKLMDAAKKEIADHTLTEETKIQYMDAISKAIDNLCPDISKLSELYDRVQKDMLPYKEFYVSFTLVDSLLPGAKELIEEPKRFYQNDITSLYEALQLAVDNLRVDKTQLNKAIERANAIMLNAESYPQEQIKKLESALKAAINVNNDNTVLAPQVNNATKQLQDALEGVQLDKTGLLNLIIESYAYIGVEVKYDVDLGDTEKTIIIVNEDDRVMSMELKHYDAFEEALANAEKVLYNSEAPSQTILNAMFDLEIAKKALKLKTDKLEDLTSRAAALLINEKYYTADSIAKLKAEKEKADAIIEGTTAADTIAARRDRYDATCKSLEAALKVEINKTELMQTITRAKAETQGVYDETSWNNLQTAISNAQAVYDKADPTVKEVYDAIAKLNDALQNLDISLDYIKDLVKQARYILDNDGVRALYTSGIDELEKRTEKAEELCKLNASEVNVTDVKNASRLLQAALDALKVSDEELKHYIAMGITDWSDDYIQDGVYSEESTDAYRELAQQAQNALSSMTDSEVAAWTLRLKNAFESLKANSDKLSAIVNRISGMSNKKYRQDNDGKWIVDEDTGNMKIFVIYEAKSWKVLETELLKAKELLLNSKATPEQINNACTALEAAEAGLIVDTSELELRMQKALDLLAQQDLYTDDSIVNLQGVYDAAKELLDNAKESGEKLAMSAVQTCLDNLLVAIDSMEADTFAIYELLDIAKDLLDHKDYCTKASADKLNSSYDQVNSLLDKGAELDAAGVTVLAQLLTDSMGGLVISTEKLQEFIGYHDFLVEYKEYLDNFDAFSVYIKEFRKLLTGNKLKITTYMEAVEKLQETYVNAIGALTSAYTALRPNWTAYEGLVSDGKGILSKALQVEGTNTEALEAALNEADGLLGTNPRLETYDEMISSVQALKAALQSLKALELGELVQATKEAMASEVVKLKGEDGPETKLSDYYGAGATVSVVYTTTSYRALQNALKQGEDVLKIANPSYDAVDGAISAINTALEGLVVDPALINHLIKECDDLYVEAYYETEDNQFYDDYSEKLAACKEIIKDSTTSLEDYLIAYGDLVEAKKWLVFKSNVLAEIITKAEAALEENGPKCTESSKTALQVQIVSARACTAASGSDDYNNACNDLLDAIANLTFIDQLQAEIARVEPFVEFGNPDEVGNFYSVGSFKDLSDLLDKAKSLVTKEGLRQYEVDSMVGQLKVCDDPEKGLLLNVTAYKKIVEEHQAFIDKNKGMYTDETWNPYVEEVEHLADLIKLSKYEVTTEQIEGAIKEAEDAKNDLEKDLNKKFMLKEGNTTFKFIYEDNSAVNFAEHQYSADKPIYLTNLALGDSVADILTQFENSDVKVFDSKGVEVTDLTKVITTGMVLKVMAGDQILDEITLVIKGDINGDGQLNTSDKNQLFAQLNGTKTLEGALKLACDINGDGNLNTSDKNQLFGHLNGTRDLFAGLSVKGAA